MNFAPKPQNVTGLTVTRCQVNIKKHSKHCVCSSNIKKLTQAVVCVSRNGASIRIFISDSASVFACIKCQKP